MSKAGRIVDVVAELARLRSQHDDPRARLVTRAALRLATGAFASTDERRVTSRVEELRRHLHTDDRPLAGDASQTVATQARMTSKGRRWVRFLTRLALDLQPASVLEMGTSVGVSGAALASSLPEGGRLTTVEGRGDVADIARESFASVGVADRVDLRVGRFQAVLEDALADAAPIDLLFIDGHHDEVATPAYLEQALAHLSPAAVVLFDDIHWSAGMERAWDRIRAHPAATFTADLYQLGVWAFGGRR